MAERGAWWRSPVLRTAAFLALLVALNAALTPGFLALEVRDGRLFGALIDIVHRSTPTLLVALGMALVIGTGGVDLSVGSVMAIAATLAGRLVRDAGLGPLEVVALVVLGGALLGAFNGALVAKLGLQPIVATLILYTAGRGLAQLASDGTVVTFESASFAALAGGAWLGLPTTAWIALAVFVLLALALRRTAFGLYLEALGDNPRAAFLAGLPTSALTLAVYGLCAALAGLAGALVASDIRAGDPSSTGLYVELDAILAVVIGGTSLRGGRVQLLGTVLGVWILQTLTTSVLMHGARLDLALVVKALAVLAACAAQSPRLRELVRRRREVRA